MKPKIGIYLDDHVAKRLNIAARRPGATKSAIVNEALDRFFGPAREKDRNEEVLQRLEGLGKTLRKILRETEIMALTFATFVRYFLTITPPLPESERQDAEARGRERYKVFITEVGRQVTSDRTLMLEVMRSMIATFPQLVARAAAETSLRDAIAARTQPAANSGMAHGSRSPKDVSHG